MKKKTLTLLLFMLVFTGAWAGDVSPEQALQQAKTFLMNQPAGSGPRHAPGTTPQLTLKSRMNGLYLFNVADNGGFVIVSNDDRTLPVLGFSNSGSIDPDRMPSNMRAWLQGYADQIAWLQKQDIQAGKPAQKRAPRRVDNPATNYIDPLVKTTWNQLYPYNLLCPAYIDEERSATGCVATAMAQVMNYHQWPKATTVAIPGYTTASYGLNLTEDLPATTFDWDNMSDNYKENDEDPIEQTDEQREAVAKLMQYCGYSVQMDYGPSSSSNTAQAANALKTYFDYNETTKLVVRSFYTYADWTDLIYHELANGRPVIYGGQSSGGGHEFVCDGYKYEDGTDYFHINWGWGGMSDEFYVLSVLNPDVQGTGGSASTDGYHFGQDAIIGIQPKTGTGTTLDITPNEINLMLNSMTVSKSEVFVGEQVTLTLNVTNNGTAEYSGDIFVGLKEDSSYRLLMGNDITIPAGQAVDYVFPFAATEKRTYEFVFFWPNAGGSYTTDGQVCATLTASVPEGLTVYDGTKQSETVPVYLSYLNHFSRSQYVIPATQLTAMQSGTINGLVYYISSYKTPFITKSSVDVYLKEVSYTSISAFETKESSTLVYQGKLSIGQDGDQAVLIIPFTTPYLYNGGNLMVGIENATQLGYELDVYSLGQEVAGASIAGYSESSPSDIKAIQQNFIPKTTFFYDAASGPVYLAPVVGIPAVTAETVTVTWNAPVGEGTVTEYVCQYRRADAEEWSEAVSTTETSVTFEGLDIATDYVFRVKAVYGVEGESVFAIATFTTKLSDDMCYITLELTDKYGDGWNGNAIQIVDVETGYVIGTFTNTDEAGKEAQTYLCEVPNGRDIQFQWVRGDYADECSYAVYDVNGELIFSGSNALNNPVTYHVNCTQRPKDLVASSVGPTSATISWTGNTDSYDVRYAPLSETGIGSGWLKYDDGVVATYLGNSTESTWTWGVMYPANQVTGNTLTKVSYYENSENIQGDVTVSIYSGGDTPSGTPIYTETVAPSGSTGFHEVAFAAPVAITPGENLWITLTATGTYLMAMCNSSEPNNQWILNGSWGSVSDIGSGTNGWMIRGYLVSTPDSEWITATCDDESYTMTGLTPETTYIVQVRSDYGNDVKSDWTTCYLKTGELLTLVDGLLVDNPTYNSTLIEDKDRQTTNVILANRTLYKDGNWNTLCLPFDVTLANSQLAGATAKTLESATLEGTHVDLVFGDAVTTLKAGVPYIIKWDGDGSDNIVEPIFADVTVISSTAAERIISLDNGNVQFIGYYDAFNITAADEDIYYMTAGNTPDTSTLKHTGKNRTLNACRAYFRFSPSVAGGARSFTINFGEGDVMTGIADSLNANDGRSTSGWYTVDGKKLNGQPMRKGVYIHNGNKVVIK